MMYYKNHTHGAHLRISFWHLLMNFEKPKKSEFRKKEKKTNKQQQQQQQQQKLLEISSLHTCVPKTTIWCSP